jgi:hypothetical protein
MGHPRNAIIACGEMQPDLAAAASGGRARIEPPVTSNPAGSAQHVGREGIPPASAGRSLRLTGVGGELRRSGSGSAGRPIGAAGGKIIRSKLGHPRDAIIN